MPDLYDLYDLYDPARVAGWEPYNLHDPRTCWIDATQIPDVTAGEDLLIDYLDHPCDLQKQQLYK